MSSDYYFLKWRRALQELEQLIHLDLEYQRSKAHDKKRCDAVRRLSGVLGKYMEICNNAMDCWLHNIQVQKATYMCDIIRAITNRIMALKHDIRKLEHSNTQFLGRGLIDHKLTTFDVELNDIPIHIKRSALVEDAIAEAFKKAEDKRELLRMEQVNKEQEEIEGLNYKIKNWWDDDASDEENISEVYETDEKPEIDETKIQTKAMVLLIQAHERSRKVIQVMTQRKLRRVMWEKELRGELKAPARLELKERSAKLIQKVFRAYFEIKRKTKQQCEKDQLLGLRVCGKIEKNVFEETNEIKTNRIEQRKKIEDEWDDFRVKMKEDFMKRRGEDIIDDYRDLIYAWFRKWFDDIHYFYDIPKPAEGGSSLIIKEEIPEPKDWWETYQAYLQDKKANKNQSDQMKKFEEQQAKKEAQNKKRSELQIKKLEEKLQQKMRKNPTLHPGFIYPMSKKTDLILELIEHYRNDWDDLDDMGSVEVKERFVPALDMNDIYAEAKLELIQTVDEDMTHKLKILKSALKKDYEHNGDKFPEPMKKRRKTLKRIKRVKCKMSDIIAHKMEDLVYRNILKQYSGAKLADFIGNHNYVGDEMRCSYKLAPAFPGETRAFWWEKCLDVTHGFRKILIVGPCLSGKTVLVNALATVVGAVLFELDLSQLLCQSLATTDIQQLVNSVFDCAKVAEPAVIYIKHIHRLFNNKTQLHEENINLDAIKKMITTKIKKINKANKITVIGTCIEPWRIKSNQLLKLLPIVVMVPDTSHSVVFSMLTDWVKNNNCLPRNLDIHSLAFTLRGYNYGQLQETLRAFLSPERIVRIAAYGLNPTEVFEYVLEKDVEIVDYASYVNWYSHKTKLGKKETKHIERQLEFKRAVEIYAAKAKKGKRLKAGSKKA